MGRNNPIPEELDRFTRVHITASIRNKQDAEDLIQEVRVMYLVMLKRYSDHTVEEQLKIARTACRNKVRDWIRNRRKPMADLPMEHSFIDTAKMDRESALQVIMSRMSERNRSILHYLALGLDRRDVENLFSVSRVTIHRCLTEARKSVTEEDFTNAIHSERSTNGDRTRTECVDSENSEEGWGDNVGTLELLHH